MGIGDFVEKAKDVAADNPVKVKDGIETAGDPIDEKTGGDHTDKIGQGEEARRWLSCRPDTNRTPPR